MVENKPDFSDEDTLRDYVYEFSVWEEELGKSRWSEHMVTVFQLEDKFYKVYWDKGLTENQEDSFYGDEPVEVFPVQEVTANNHITYVENPQEHSSLKITSEDLEGTALIVDNALNALNALKNADVDIIIQLLETIEPVFVKDNHIAFHTASKEFFNNLKEAKKNL